jgi:4-amino-4-deoxy-L-arabinose transferase-like glycosyltransferase
MSTATMVDKEVGQETALHKLFPPQWQTLTTYAVGLVFLLLGFLLRLHDLGLPFDRDGYDEGVYWQSLRAMAAGHTLYQQIFYSQPPFFLLSIYPFYTLFGQTLWAARLGIAVVSLTGLVGAFYLGKAISGRIGALIALLLMMIDPFYMSQSQKLEAEAPSAGLSLLAVGLAYMWWENPEGAAGLWLAALCGISAALSILSKLLGVTALVPVGLLMLAHLWRIWRRPRAQRLSYARSLLLGIAAFVLTMLLFLLPFVGARHEFWAGVVTFHTAAAQQFKSTLAGNFPSMVHLLTSPTAIIALFSLLVALLRRDWRVLPLVAWLVATVLVLVNQAPLFHHHLVALIPPMIALAVVGISPFIGLSRLASLLSGNVRNTTAAKAASEADTLEVQAVSIQEHQQNTRFAIAPQVRSNVSLLLRTVGSIVTLVALLIVLIINLQGAQQYFQGERTQGASNNTQQGLLVAQDLHNATHPGDLVITDAQFLVALADRNTPPSLVDTSIVRIDTNYLTLQQLIQAASQPQVHAVLFYTGRLSIASVTAFHAWVATHGFHLIRHYKSGQELWIRA